MRHPCAHIGHADLFERAKAGGVTKVLPKKRQKPKDIGAIRGNRIFGVVFQRFLVGQPAFQRIKRCGGDMGQASQRCIARSNTPAKNVRRSVPCVGLN